MQTFISYAEAQRIIAEAVPDLPEETVHWPEALGRILREPIISREAVPRFDNSAMDGYAVRMRDVERVPVTLPVVDTVAAGRASLPELAPGTAIRIMTGAPLPTGAEAVVPVEWTESPDAATVRILRQPEPGAHIRRRGEDVRPGEELIPSGSRVTPPVIGLMATMGYTHIRVSRRPRVAILTTGSELVPPEATPDTGQIRDSNGPTLRAQALLTGAEVPFLLHAPDDRSAIAERLEEARQADALLLSGGVSMGAYDLVREVLEAMGVRWLFWKVRQRPGKPLAFGMLGDTPVFGLPGNPVSASVCFEVYVRPALGCMMQARPPGIPLIPARMDAPVTKKPELHYFSRGYARVDEQGHHRVTPLRRQGSHMFYGMAEANCLIHLAEGTDRVEADQIVFVQPLTWTS